ncbi:MAG: tetratricopeptide repeat protein [Terriglobia bacterium]
MAMEQARAHVQAREYDAALKIFRRLAEANPRDYEARVWVARLLSWQGDYARSQELYQAVLRDDPGNLEAELGLADILGWQGRLQDARQRLATLQAQHPGNIEILLHQGTIARWQGRHREALAYYREVLRLEPANPEALEAIEALRAEPRYEIETGYFLEEFDFTGNTNGNFASVLYHDNHRTWLLGRVQYQNKFDQNNTRFTAGATYRFFASTYVQGKFSWAPAGDTVIPNQDYTVEVTQGLAPGWAVGGGYRFLNFRDAEVQVLTALVNWDARPNLHLFVRYTPARTDFDRPSTHVWNQGGWAQLVWDAHRRFSPFVLFGVGSESFAGVSADQLGRFAAQTYAVGAEARLTSSQGIRMNYHFQNRTGGKREQGFGLSYFFRF